MRLRAEAITKEYPGTTALRDVSFDVLEGKVNVLIGENGAGKSTLMKILAGIEQPTAGRIMLDGREVRFRSPRDAAHRGIAIIHQELNLFPNLSVAANIFLGRERGRRAEYRESRALLGPLDASIDPRSPLESLRLGQQQIVAIARALSESARVLIMDEPTSALSGPEIASLFRVIRDLRQRGVSIVYISHRLEELLEIGDEVTVLRDGCVAGRAHAADIDVPWIIENMTGRGTAVYTRTRGEPGEVLLEVTGLRLPGACEGISFRVRAGEVLGIYGLAGAGRTELLETLAGLRRAATGAILLLGEHIELQPISGRIARGLSLVPEDRQSLGLVPTLSVLDNMILASLPRFYVSHLGEGKRVEPWIRELGIKLRDPGQPVTSLSGGNQQKVVVAKYLLTSPKVLLMDEPARGIDVAAKAEIRAIVDRLAARGVGVVFVSSELKEVLAMADRILVMSNRRLTGEFDARAARPEYIVAASAAGLGGAHV